MLIVITGPASSGKDTVMQNLLLKFPQMKRVISTTTRERRHGEVDGKDYHFISRSQFESLIKEGKFLEFVELSGHLYGTTRDELDPLQAGADLIWRIDTTRAAQIKELSQDLWKKTLVLYIDAPDWKILEARMKKRGMKEDKIKERLKTDRADFKKFKSRFENIIYNEDGKLDQTMERILELIKLRKQSS